MSRDRVKPIRASRARPPKVKPGPGLKQPRSMTGGRGASPTVSLRLPPEVHQKLIEFAEDRGHPTISAAARDIIEIWLAGS